MDLFNRTPAQAGIFSTVIEKDRMMASVVIRETHLIEAGELRLDADAPWAADGAPIKTEFGEFDADSPFPRAATDVFVLGKAYPPVAGNGTEARVEIGIGLEFSSEILVRGDRRWVRQGADLVASRPEPFDAIPLTWEYAYGGKCASDTGDFAFPTNPHGRGLYLTAEQAEGGVLPNLEHPQWPVRTWQDRPEPVAMSPLGVDSGFRALRAAQFDTASVPPKVLKIRQQFFNNAAPRMMTARAIDPDAAVHVQGVRPGGRELRFRLPGNQYHVYVQLANRAYVFPAHIDFLAVLAEEQRVVVGYRCAFRYRFSPLERRAAVLYPGSVPDAPRAGYLIDWDAADRAAREALHG